MKKYRYIKEESSPISEGIGPLRSLRESCLWEMNGLTKK